MAVAADIQQQVFSLLSRASNISFVTADQSSGEVSFLTPGQRVNAVVLSLQPDNRVQVGVGIERFNLELEKILAKRSELAARVETKSLAKYERLLKNKDGLAIVPISNEACQGCFRRLPPQVINEIRMYESLVVCDSCARLLYIAPPEE